MKSEKKAPKTPAKKSIAAKPSKPIQISNLVSPTQPLSTIAPNVAETPKKTRGRPRKVVNPDEAATPKQKKTPKKANLENVPLSAIKMPIAIKDDFNNNPQITESNFNQATVPVQILPYNENQTAEIPTSNIQTNTPIKKRAYTKRKTKAIEKDNSEQNTNPSLTESTPEPPQKKQRAPRKTPATQKALKNTKTPKEDLNILTSENTPPGHLIDNPLPEKIFPEVLSDNSVPKATSSETIAINPTTKDISPRKLPDSPITEDIRPENLPIPLTESPVSRNESMAHPASNSSTSTSHIDTAHTSSGSAVNNSMRVSDQTPNLQLNDKVEISSEVTITSNSTGNLDTSLATINSIPKYISSKENMSDNEKHSPEVKITAIDENNRDKIQDKNESSDSSSSSEESSSEDEDQTDICERKDLPQHLAERAKKLSELRMKMKDSVIANKKDVYREHEKSKINPKANLKLDKKRKAAQELLFKQKVEDSGLDFERIRSWDYSIESVEKFNSKLKEKEENTVTGFADWNDVAQRKYNKLVKELKPDNESYNYQKKLVQQVKDSTGNSVVTDEDVSLLLQTHLSKPTDHAVEKLSKSIIDQYA
ncbi:Pre-mRNA-splicing factor syf2, partial [Smittium culicis]